MAVNTRIDKKGSFTGSVGGVAIPYRFGNSAGTMPNGKIRLYNGTGATQMSVVFVKAWTIAAGANLDIDLTSGQTDINVVAVNLTKLKYLYCEVTSPGATDYVKLGPLNVTNAIQLWFGGVTATYYEEVRASCEHVISNGAGYTVDATHKVIRINNPTAGSLSGFLIVGGI